MKKLVVTIVLVLLVAMVGVWGWARVALGGDAVRRDVASQVSEALGQPVSIGAIGPTFFPRLSLTLQDVMVGSSDEIAIDRVDMSAALVALASRRIEHASVRVSGAHVELPLPVFTLPASSSGDGGGGGVEIVSVDEIVISDLTIVGGDRTLTADVDVVPDSSGLTIRRIALTGAETDVEVTGRLSSLAGPVGEVAIAAGSLDLLDLAAMGRALGGDATGGPGESPVASPRSDAPAPRSLLITLDVDRALVGPVVLDTVRGEARLTDDGLTLDPLKFDLLGGRGQASVVTARGGGVPTYRMQASLEGLDVARAAAAAGKPDTMTGQMRASLDVTGQTGSLDAARQTAVGTARVEATDGTVPGLGFVQTLSALTSERGGGLAGRGGLLSGDAGGASAADAYSRIGLSMNLAGGLARTDDFRFESSEVLVTAAGTIALDGSAVDLTGQAQLSNGMTAPARVTGSVTDPHFDIAGGGGGNAIDLENIDVESAIKSLLGGLGGSRGR